MTGDAGGGGGIGGKGPSLAASHRSPHTFPRRILACVIGLTPQIVTETLFALVVKQNPPFVPTEIHIATTRQGRERLMLTLLDRREGRLGAFAREFGRPDLADALSPERIAAIRGADGHDLDDIVSEDGSRAAADTITRFVRGLTRDADAAVHLSIAGGRKTMGFLAGYALSLFGRPQDRLSHVLVSPEFEANRNFYYPPRDPTVVYTRDRQGREVPLDTGKAEILLADIPFVRLRRGLPPDLLSGQATYSATVEALDRSLAEPSLVIDAAKGEVHCHRQHVPLQRLQMAFLLYLARLRRDSDHPYDGAVRWNEASVDELLRAYDDIPETVKGTGGRGGRTLIEGGIDEDYFRSKRSQVNRRLKDVLKAAATPYLIQSYGRRPNTRAGLSLPRSAIRIIEARARS